MTDYEDTPVVPEHLLDKVRDNLDKIPPMAMTDAEKAKAFADEWNRMIAVISGYAKRWDLPEPQMIFHPKWHYAISYYGGTPIAPTIINRDVKVRFGMFEPVEGEILRISR